MGKGFYEKKKNTAIAALIACKSTAIAAKRIGIAESTLYKWLLKPDFQQEYKRARQAVVEVAISKLQKSTGRAVELLDNVISDRKAPLRLRIHAARTIVENSIRLVLQDSQGVSPIVDNRQFDIKVLLASPETRKALDMLSNALENGQKQPENAPQTHP